VNKSYCDRSFFSFDRRGSWTQKKVNYNDFLAIEHGWAGVDLHLGLWDSETNPHLSGALTAHGSFPEPVPPDVKVVILGSRHTTKATDHFTKDQGPEGLSFISDLPQKELNSPLLQHLLWKWCIKTKAQGFLGRNLCCAK
jgi:hypothetical protein